MNAIASEFRDIFELYLKLCTDLTRIMDSDDPADSSAYVQSILKNRDCLVRIERMNARVLQLAHDWEKCRDTLDSASADEVRDQIQQAKAQAIRLQEVCRLHAQKLQMTRNTLGERIAALGNAARHLESLKPIKNNYPKFIDSRY